MPMWSAFDVIRLTGSSALRASHQPAIERAASAAGTARSRSVRTRATDVLDRLQRLGHGQHVALAEPLDGRERARYFSPSSPSETVTSRACPASASARGAAGATDAALVHVVAPAGQETSAGVEDLGGAVARQEVRP